MLPPPRSPTSVIRCAHPISSVFLSMFGRYSAAAIASLATKALVTNTLPVPSHPICPLQPSGNLARRGTKPSRSLIQKPTSLFRRHGAVQRQSGSSPWCRSILPLQLWLRDALCTIAPARLSGRYSAVIHIFIARAMEISESPYMSGTAEIIKFHNERRLAFTAFRRSRRTSAQGLAR
jgi:hypothetical protein